MPAPRKPDPLNRNPTNYFAETEQVAWIEIADSVDAAFTAKLAAGLGLHRAWDRAAAVMASAAPAG